MADDQESEGSLTMRRPRWGIRGKIRSWAKDFRPPSAAQQAEHYVKSGSVPWTPHYLAYRERVIQATLGDPQILARFREGEALPENYGMTLDERCIEYPWVLSRLNPGPARLLDAGSPLNYEYLLEQPQLRDKTLHVLTLAPEKGWTWHLGPSYLFADLRDLPVRSDYYDAVVCISTLEHVGLDNQVTTGHACHAEARPMDCLTAIKELNRVLRPGGTLYVTVPFGRYQNMGWQQQFDEKLLTKLLEGFGPSESTEVAFYQYQPSGWQQSSAEASADVEYVAWISNAWYSEQWPDPVPVEADRAAAARAVACAALVKPAAIQVRQGVRRGVSIQPV